MSAAGLLLRLCAYVLVGWSAWVLSVRVGPSWLRRGEGPLWMLATVPAVAAAIAALVAGPDASWVVFLRFRAAEEDGFHWLLVGSLAGLCTYAALRIAIGATREKWPFWRPFFLSVGALPDGSSLRDLWNTGSLASLVLLFLVIAVGFFGSVEHVGGVFPITWGLSTSAMLCMGLAYIHPREPSRLLEGDGTDAELDRLATRPVLDRIQPLVHWLRAAGPLRIADTRDHSAGPVDASGLWGFQLDGLAALDASPNIAVTGPAGAGRSTLAFLLASAQVVGRGTTALLVVSSEARVRDLMRVIRAAQARWVDAGILTVQSGPDGGRADVWVATSRQVVEHLDLYLGGQHEARHRFLDRVGIVCFDDVEDFSGPMMLEQRYLLFRIEAVAGIEQEFKRVIVGGLADTPMLEASKNIAAAENFILISGWDSGLGPTRPVVRYKFDWERVSWQQFNRPVGVPALIAGVEHYSSRRETRAMAFDARLQLAPAVTTWARRHGAVVEVLPTDEVTLVRVDGTNASELLARGRHYHPSDDQSAVELLVFANDPMSRWLEIRWDKMPAAWPSELRLDRYPRVLASLPGHGLAVRGALVIARHHLRAAMSVGPQSLDRLNYVFSPGVVEGFIREAGEHVEHLGIWRAVQISASKVENPHFQGEVAPAHTLMEAVCLHTGAGAQVDELPLVAQLHAPAEGRTRRMAAEIVNYEAPIRCVVSLDGSRYEVMPDEGRGDPHRVINLVDDARQTAPIRRLKFQLGESRGGQETIQFAGSSQVRSQRYQARVHLAQSGVHVFNYLPDGDRMRLRRENTVLLERTIVDDRLQTDAWVIRFDSVTETVLHTLTHILRDSIDYFFMGGSTFLGVSYQMNLGGEPALVFYERAVGGNGCLDTVRPREDLECMLANAKRLLNDCPGLRSDVAEHACGICCRSVSCTLEEHNSMLDAIATAKWLEGFGKRLG